MRIAEYFHTLVHQGDPVYVDGGQPAQILSSTPINEAPPAPAPAPIPGPGAPAPTAPPHPPAPAEATGPGARTGGHSARRSGADPMAEAEITTLVGRRARSSRARGGAATRCTCRTCTRTR